MAGQKSGAAVAKKSEKPSSIDKTASKGAKKGGDYGASSIQVLEGLEAVRKRPGMYIGSTDERGLHHLVYEVVDNSVDEAMAGHATRILVRIHKDNSIEVVDDGRGVPVGKHSTGKDALEVVHTVLHAGGKFGGGGYKVSGGLHGVGVSVVNALSVKLRVESARDGFVWAQEYERGKPKSKVTKIGPANSRRGTRTVFLPDPEVFSTTEYSFETLSNRLRESAYLNKGLWLTLIDDRADREATFYFQGGIVSFVRHLNRKRKVTHDRPVFLERVDGTTNVEVAFQYQSDSWSETLLAFANNINTVDGGTHVTGFRAALTSSLNDWGRKNGAIKDNDPNLTGEDVREGLTAVISVKLQDPQFEGQTKTKLGNTEAKAFVQKVVGDRLGDWFDRNPAQARNVVRKAIDAATARLAARKAREACGAEQRRGVVAQELLDLGVADDRHAVRQVRRGLGADRNRGRAEREGGDRKRGHQRDPACGGHRRRRLARL